MREILFRGKAIENYGKYKIGDWIYGNFIEGMNKNDCCINPKGTVNHIQVGPETVGQYVATNFEGYQIFEGDFVKFPSDKMVGKVIWGAAEFWIVYDDAQYNVTADEICCYSLLGNKWDNPELWKEVKL